MKSQTHLLGFILLSSTVTTWSQNSGTVEPPALSAASVTLSIRPQVTRSIEGHTDLERHRYFALAHGGKNFEKQTAEGKRYQELVEELDISFGRDLGPVRSVVRWTKSVREDEARPGHADLAFLKEQLGNQDHQNSPRLTRDFSPNLEVAAHGLPGGYPEFMGQWMPEEAKKSGHGHRPPVIPVNTEAAAELAAAVLEHNFTDLTRPRYFEPINEPHWSFLLNSPERIANWHLETKKAVSARTPEVLVGGPCNAVGNFYRNDYQAFNGVRKFMDNTANGLDFYSFHTYDYHSWNGQNFGGMILSGLPLEGIIDLVPNYTLISQGKACSIVISEQGGYAASGNGDSNHDLILKVAEEVMERKEGESEFDYALRARSIHDFLHINSMVANALVFMDHPQTVLKAVPFVLLHSANWDPKYYAVLYAPRDFEQNGKDWVPTGLHNYYRLFAGVNGRRIAATSNDPDVMCRSFVDGNKLFVIAHNLSRKPEKLNLDLSISQPNNLQVRRLSQNEDLTLSYREEQTEAMLHDLAPQETIVFVAEFAAPIAEEKHFNETIHYGGKVMVPAGTSIPLTVPNPAEVKEATLRIGFHLPKAENKSLVIKLNGKEIPNQVEDSAARFVDKEGAYSSCRIIKIESSLLQENNSVEVLSTVDEKVTIGSAVLRTLRPL
ncbi:hypothetical protein [Roseibacillus persicicus]|uniref:hypothetical protein n=1 Tax=Roseibacillus persicicus TaxID=454148 RepID=UPI00280D0AE3|nr:hypothetical protein [Roseibacillus persicicus]MDQ8191441.1 hypothetical protein [Roseibacillus persicicus]